MCIRDRHDGSPCVDRGPNIIVQAAGFSGGQGAKSGGIGYAEELSPTLKAAASGSNRSPCVLSLSLIHIFPIWGLAGFVIFKASVKQVASLLLGQQF